MVLSSPHKIEAYLLDQPWRLPHKQPMNDNKKLLQSEIVDKKKLTGLGSAKHKSTMARSCFDHPFIGPKGLFSQSISTVNCWNGVNSSVRGSDIQSKFFRLDFFAPPSRVAPSVACRSMLPVAEPSSNQNVSSLSWWFDSTWELFQSIKMYGVYECSINALKHKPQ